MVKRLFSHHVWVVCIICINCMTEEAIRQKSSTYRRITISVRTCGGLVGRCQEVPSDCVDQVVYVESPEEYDDEEPANFVGMQCFERQCCYDGRQYEVVSKMYP